MAQNFSIIIPIYNEAPILTAMARHLLEDPILKAAEIIFVCNGCTDESVSIARSFEPRVTVIETPVGSKTGALNLGDQAASAFPRLYLDADIAVSNQALCAVADCLRGDTYLAAGLTLDFDTSGSSSFVKRFYKVWLNLPYVASDSSIGSGLYALSKTGRDRFKDFPNIIADDGFVDASFEDTEKHRPEGHKMTIRTPSDLLSLIRIKSRVHRGKKELKAHVETRSQQIGNSLGDVIRLVRTGRVSFIDAAVYIGCVISSRLHARFIQPLTKVRWEKDHSSRHTAPERKS